MGGPGSGGHNAAKRPSAPASPLVQPQPWPWESAETPWPRGQIHEHLVQYTYECGLSREHLSDVISALADHHWLKASALAAIDAWEKRKRKPKGQKAPQVGGINAYRLLLLCDEKIAGDWRRLGVKAQERRATPPNVGTAGRRDFRPGTLNGATQANGTARH